MAALGRGRSARACTSCSTGSGRSSSWPVPPPFRNHGNFVVSVAELNRWLSEKAEEAGAYILTETTGHKLLVEDGVVIGVRTGDKGRDKYGGEKGNFEPGSDVMARATVLAEGCWGHLTGAAQKGLGLAGTDPQVWALGVKEVWEVEQPLDKVDAHARLAAAPAGASTRSSAAPGSTA